MIRLRYIVGATLFLLATGSSFADGFSASCVETESGRYTSSEGIASAERTEAWVNEKKTGESLRTIMLRYDDSGVMRIGRERLTVVSRSEDVLVFYREKSVDGTDSNAITVFYALNKVTKQMAVSHINAFAIHSKDTAGINVGVSVYDCELSD